MLRPAYRAATRFSVPAAVNTPNALYLHAPNGIGRSRLAATAEQCLGVETTSRNWRTLCKVAAMAASIS